MISTIENTIREVGRRHIRRLRQRTRRAVSLARRLWERVEPLWPAAIVLIPLVVVLVELRRFYFGFSEIGKGIYVEAWGTVFDILIVGIILALFVGFRDRRERTNRYLEEIDDFKKWDSQEAWLRIAGNIRRLAKLGKTDIDFSGIVLRNVSFQSHDIESLKGSTFSSGLRIDRMSKNDTKLENVDFWRRRLQRHRLLQGQRPRRPWWSCRQESWLHRCKA